MFAAHIAMAGTAGARPPPPPRSKTDAHTLIFGYVKAASNGAKVSKIKPGSQKSQTPLPAGTQASLLWFQSTARCTPLHAVADLPASPGPAGSNGLTQNDY